MNNPKVSCIMPTANRPNFISLAIEYFLNQSYRNTELIIVDDGRQSVKSLIPNHRKIRYFQLEPFESLGLKRNYACEQAVGELILHWDDDDYYGYDWIKRSVQALDNSGADICGLNEIKFYSPLKMKFWLYSDKQIERPWLSGATMCYKKSFWEAHPFKNIHIGEDYDYIWNNNARIFAHDYNEGFVAILHANNTTLKPFEDKKFKKNASKWMDVKYEGESENPKKE